jgi:hypothetical protein
MPNKKISELVSGTPTLTSVLPVSDSAGTVTNKVTVQAILNADARWALFLPAAPTSLTTTAGNAQVILAWTAPTVSAQTPITDYLVQSSTNSGSTWTTVSDGTSTATSATVTGLTNGTPYVFRVAAVNGVGTGAYSSATSSVTPGAGDPNFANVSLLMHFEGSSFVDSGPLALSLTRESTDAQLSSAQARFGSKSGFWANNAPGSNVYTPNSTAFGFGTGDFTIEFWYRYQEGNGTIIAIGSEETYVQADNGGGLYVKGVWENQISGGVPVGQWVHVAICRSAGTTHVYTGGTRRAQISDTTNFGSSAVFRIGRPGGWAPPSQYIDELRVTKGVARFTGATMTVPEAAYPDS